ncbi:hypothetical protein V6M85_08340 [Sulfolobus tengchongensis]|uniref:Uncharacterized protein n=1 Tax=Sulfolobus tengchongensis TaxID=207809 RepID=A0AAX4L007_9CREN
MCFLRIIEVTRPIISNDIVLLRRDIFRKLKDDIYLRVLSTDKRGEEISKSYFYFIVDKLRKMNLLLDNAVSFKAVLPYETKNNTVLLEDGILYISSKKQMIFFDADDQSTYICNSCTLLSSCVPALKQIAYELGIQIRSDIPNIAWYRILESIKEIIIQYSVSLKLKLGEIPISNKVNYKEEEVKKVRIPSRSTNIQSTD